MRERSHEKFAQVSHVRIETRHFEHNLHAVGHDDAAVSRSAGKELHECVFQRGDVGLRKTAALQADAVDHANFRTRSAGCDHHHIRRNVSGHARHPADERVLANGDEVVNGCATAHVHMILNTNMAGELHAVGDDTPIADKTIVSHVNADEEQIIVPDMRDAAAIARAGMHRDHFAKDIAIADFEKGALAAEFHVLRRGAENGLRKYLATRAESRETLD